MVYNFLLNMWVMKKVDEQYLQGQVSRQRITQQEYDMIIATPQDLSRLRNKLRRTKTPFKGVF